MTQEDRIAKAVDGFPHPGDGGPAFPVITTHDTVTSGSWASNPGMTLRAYYAAKAMAALIEGYDHEARMASTDKNFRQGFDAQPHNDSFATYASHLAEESFIIADAMIAQQQGTVPFISRAAVELAAMRQAALFTYTAMMDRYDGAPDGKCQWMVEHLDRLASALGIKS